MLELLDSYLVGKALASEVAGEFRGDDESWAVFDATGRHRYALARVWGELGADFGVDACMFLLLNPSTADERILDRTLTRCRDYALRWGYGGMLVANVCSFRATWPTALRRPEAWEKAAENAHAIDVLAGMSETIVCGWGSCPSVTRSRIPDLQAGNIAWCVEEALWQLRCIAKHATTLHIPGAGTWKRCG